MNQKREQMQLPRKTDGRKNPNKLPFLWMANPAIRASVIERMETKCTMLEVIEFLRVQHGVDMKAGTISRFIHEAKAGLKRTSGTAFLRAYLEDWDEYKQARVTGTLPKSLRPSNPDDASENSESKGKFSEADFAVLNEVATVLQVGGRLALSPYIKLAFGPMADLSKGKLDPKTPIGEIPMVPGAQITVIVPPLIANRHYLEPRQAYSIAALLKKEFKDPKSVLIQSAQGTFGRVELLIQHPGKNPERLAILTIPLRRD